MKHSYLTLAVVAALSTAVLVGCDKSDEAAAEQAAAAQQQAPVEVTVQTVSFQSIPNVKTFSGRTSAYQTSDVRPQVSGIIDEILFQEGSMVRAGQPLYRINPDNYTSSVASGQAAVQEAQASLATAQATHASAKADLVSQQASLAQAQSDLNRMEGLVEVDAISQQSYDQYVTTARTAAASVESARAAVSQAAAGIESAKAAVESAKANLAASRLDYERTIVRAPISGRTDRSDFTAGALVSASQSDALVTISRLDPIYVDISQSSSEMLQLRQQLSSGQAQAGSAQVELVLEDGTVYPARGQLALAEARVDESTGAVTLRAVFPNSQSVLLPGMYVTARLAQTTLVNAVLLPQSAVQRTNKGDTQVYIVDANNQVQVRPVTVNGTHEGKWIITDGLESGDKVIVEGVSTVKPEQEVTVKSAAAASASQGAQAGQAAQGAQSNGQGNAAQSEQAQPAQASGAQAQSGAQAEQQPEQQGEQPAAAQNEQSN